jgi:SAM-dependent methyltransferase
MGEVAIPHPGFEPVFVTDDMLDDLAGFTGMSTEACRARLRSYSPVELADAWNRANPQTDEELLNFYRTTDLYIWDLLQWHASADRHRRWRTFADTIERFPSEAGFARVYDFGAGVGTDALFLASRGYHVTLVDVAGPVFRFAQYRFQRRGLPGRFIESRSPLPEPDDTYDIAMCFDVFEHLPDPLAAARRLVGALRPGGLLIQASDFNHDDVYPQHLAEGARRFEGPRWDMYLSGLGLRHDGHLAYRRLTGWRSFAVRGRYALWRATGLWVIRTPPR